MADGRQLLSVVIPIYFEEETIPELHARTKAALAALSGTLDHELIFVNDGSTDGSLALLRELAARDPAVRVVDLSRNFGHQLAITAGIDHASGDAVVVMDGDLQDPPEVIPALVDRWRQGFKVVYGVRQVRAGEGAFKRATASVFYRLLNRMSDVPLPLDSGDFRLMDAAVTQALGSIREGNRYLRGLVSWIGFPQCGVPYERDPRHAGETKFDLPRMLRFAFDGITSFSDRPLRLSSSLGLLITVAAFLAMLWIIGAKLLVPETVIQGWTSLLVVVLFLGGTQLLSIGLLGEYVGRIYRETKRRPLYVVAGKTGFPAGREQRRSPAEAR